MRLSSLSRKLKLKPSELELFYENKGIELLASSNSKLSDEQIKIALEHYDFKKRKKKLSLPLLIPYLSQAIPAPLILKIWK